MYRVYCHNVEKYPTHLLILAQALGTAAGRSLDYPEPTPAPTRVEDYDAAIAGFTTEVPAAVGSCDV